ncbi:MAG: LytTR family DNA-binding domain-containing protein [Bacteroidota bacterium]
MKILIVEDEYHAQKYLSNLIKQVVTSAQILDMLDSVEDAVDWFQNNAAPDLIFMDIQLADGLSFNIFKKVEVNAPVIFTTAFDQYTLQAFKVNSVDYLLKPIDEIELKKAMDKYDQLYGNNQVFNRESLLKVINSFQQKDNFRQRFLIKQGKDYIYLPIEDIAYFYSADGMTFAIDTHKKRHLLDSTLDNIDKELNPKNFFRISRKQIVHIQSVAKIFAYFNHRLKLDLKPESKVEAVVSRERVKEFKAWLDR